MRKRPEVSPEESSGRRSRAGYHGARRPPLRRRPAARFRGALSGEPRVGDLAGGIAGGWASSGRRRAAEAEVEEFLVAAVREAALADGGAEPLRPGGLEAGLLLRAIERPASEMASSSRRRSSERPSAMAAAAVRWGGAGSGGGASCGACGGGGERVLRGGGPRSGPREWQRAAVASWRIGRGIGRGIGRAVLSRAGGGGRSRRRGDPRRHPLATAVRSGSGWRERERGALRRGRCRAEAGEFRPAAVFEAVLADGGAQPFGGAGAEGQVVGGEQSGRDALPGADQVVEPGADGVPAGGAGAVRIERAVVVRNGARETTRPAGGGGGILRRQSPKQRPAMAAWSLRRAGSGAAGALRRGAAPGGAGEYFPAAVFEAVLADGGAQPFGEAGVEGRVVGGEEGGRDAFPGADQVVEPGADGVPAGGAGAVRIERAVVVPEEAAGDTRPAGGGGRAPRGGGLRSSARRWRRAAVRQRDREQPPSRRGVEGGAFLAGGDPRRSPRGWRRGSRSVVEDGRRDRERRASSGRGRAAGMGGIPAAAVSEATLDDGGAVASSGGIGAVGALRRGAAPGGGGRVLPGGRLRSGSRGWRRAGVR